MIVGFDSEAELESVYANTSLDVLAGIVFHETLTEGRNTTRVIKFKIRPETVPEYFWHPSHMFARAPVEGPMDKHSLWGTIYMSFGFLHVQHALCTILTRRLFDAGKEDISVMMQRFPHPPYEAHAFYVHPEFIFVTLICASFLVPFANFAKDMVGEKERHIKEVLRVLGVARWMNWAAWYMSSLLYFGMVSGLVSTMLCTTFGRNEALFHHSSPFLVFVWLWTYSSSLVATAFLLKTLFYSNISSEFILLLRGTFRCWCADFHACGFLSLPGTAALGGALIVFFLSLMPYMHMMMDQQKTSTLSWIFFSFFPNTVLGYSLGIWIKTETMGIGLRWNNLNTKAAVAFGLGMRDVLLVFVAETIFFSFLHRTSTPCSRKRLWRDSPGTSPSQ
ncbi:ATP-binding cassette sub-family A member 3 [Caerostris darwini]|uniref:ATP-binding cassette sub-family A member 3 n=1 Tax=Caerostris darwini TaxID=1538125 RepID=A0AAV4R4J2_9ARAC|nr:ATP-binding cassette sub-family A member 3 [Caerostris darwini]